MTQPLTGAKTESQPHHVITRLKITGGFLSGAQLEFADGLNCFIGGRGAGKTTALEFLRFGLGLMPDPRASPQRHRAIDALVKANLGNGRVNIEVRTKADMHYTSNRAPNESVQVLNEAGTPVPVAFDRDLIFGADVFSQNEIEEIASSPRAQLELLDRFQERDAVAIARELENVHRELGQSSTDLLRLDDEIDDLRSKASELAVIEERLKGLMEVSGPDAARINTAHIAKTARSKEETIPALLVEALRRVARSAAMLEADFATTVEAHLDADALQGANREVFERIDAELRSFRKVLISAKESVDEGSRAAEMGLQRLQATLADRHAAQEAEYRALVSESDQKSERAAERSALQILLANAQSAANERTAKEKQREGMVRHRKALLKRASELCDRRFSLRKGVAERLSRQFPSIRVTVTQAAELERYRDLIMDALKGAGFKHGVIAERLSQVFLPTELAQAVLNRDFRSVMQRGGYDEERARRIAEAIRVSGSSYAIETVDLDDRPSIELLDGDTYKQSESLSTGQRCTTILPILLIQSERPLLIDQPEDNLDNAFIFDTIVNALQAIKGSRQVIFVTHNPNIPVLGDAERVFVFASDGRHAELRQVGTVDQCKEQIERILEGGRDAFRLRMARYGH